MVVYWEGSFSQWTCSLILTTLSSLEPIAVLSLENVLCMHPVFTAICFESASAADGLLWCKHVSPGTSSLVMTE